MPDNPDHYWPTMAVLGGSLMADVYFYNADIYCEDCGLEIRRNLNEKAFAILEANTGEIHADRPNDDLTMALGFDPYDEHSYDSGDYPKGPTGNGGGVADSPQHCATCRVFLRNPLTREGLEYVIYAVADGTGDQLAEWEAEYLSDRALRDVALKPFTNGPTYRLRTYDLYQTRNGHAQLAYIFGLPGEPALFVTCEFGASPMHSVDGDETLRAMLGFITLRPGDTEQEYFDVYTEAQMAFARGIECEYLQSWAEEDRGDEQDGDAPPAFEDFEPISTVERLAGESAHYPYLIERNGVEFIDFDGMNGDDRIRATYDPNDWSAGDYTYAEDTHTLYVTGNGQALYRNATPETYHPYAVEPDA